MEILTSWFSLCGTHLQSRDTIPSSMRWTGSMSPSRASPSTSKLPNTRWWGLESSPPRGVLRSATILTRSSRAEATADEVPPKERFNTPWKAPFACLNYHFGAWGEFKSTASCATYKICRLWGSDSSNRKVIFWGEMCLSVVSRLETRTWRSRFYSLHGVARWPFYGLSDSYLS